MRKLTLKPLSLSYKKKDGRGIWHDNDKDLKVCFLVKGLIYDLPAWHTSMWYKTSKITNNITFIAVNHYFLFSNIHCKNSATLEMLNAVCIDFII